MFSIFTLTEDALNGMSFKRYYICFQCSDRGMYQIFVGRASQSRPNEQPFFFYISTTLGEQNDDL